MAGMASWLLIAAGVALIGALAASLGVALLHGLRTPRLVPSDGPPMATSGIDLRAPRHDGAGWRAVAHLGTATAAALLSAALVARALATGHAPWSNLHEFSAAFAATVLLAYLALERRHQIRGLAPIVGVVALALLGLALSLDDRVDPLVPALQQPVLLTVHVGAAVVAYAVSAIAFAAAVGEIVQRRASDAIAALPPAATLRAVAHRSVLIAFPILTLAIVLGSVWANLAWRSSWSNDPKELAAAATWLVYGGYLHVAGRRDRWGATAPWLLVLGFAGVLFTYIGAGLFFIGEHSYAAP
jgi:cytochrome c-type biogenesis protein CcsB